jgi:hypothetical protein
VISSRATRSRAIRQLATSIVLVFGCIILPVGCGNPGAQESNMPPAEFAEKLEKEHPELFIKKTGKKTEVLGGRDKRAIIREQWQKSQQ